MRLRKKIAIGFAALYVLLAVLPLPWKGPINFPDAKISKVGDAFDIELSGRRNGMVHDPISLMIALVYPTTYPITDGITIPRDNGVIEGKEIPAKEGYYAYAGSIHISGTDLEIDLQYINTDKHVLEPIDWNGKYRLRKMDE